jgi:ABC-type cobalamin/Fe3+-siderophores transport system ATPase subunit
VIAFLGPNGAGKTTTIDIILGLSRPDAGAVKVYGMAPRQAVGVLEQLAPQVAVLGRLGVVPDRDAFRDLPRVPDRRSGVVGELQRVPQVRLDGGVDAVERVGIGRQHGDHPGQVLVHVRDA